MLTGEDAKRMANEQLRRMAKHRCEAHGIEYMGDNCPHCVAADRVIATFPPTTNTDEGTKSNG